MEYIIGGMVILLSVYYMKRIVKIHCRAKRLIYYELILNLFLKFFQGYLNVPKITSYISDIFLILIVVCYLYAKKNGSKRYIPGTLIILFVFYVLVTLWSYVINSYSIALFIWGFRNNMRFIVFAMMCAIYFDVDDVNYIFDILFGFFLVNIVAVTYEFFFAGLKFHTGDLISGLYSVRTVQGGNDALNWLLCIMCAIAITQYLNRKKNLSFLLICVFGSLYMAAMSELKIFFIEIVLIAVAAIWFSKKSLKMIMFVMIGAVGLFIGINMLYRYFPQYKNYFDVSNIGNILFSKEGYNGIGSIPRWGAFSYIFENFLITWKERLWGIGFGNADYSGISILTSTFYKKYSGVGYQWFYGPFILIETGLFGVFAYVMIVLNFLKQAIMSKSTKNDINCIRTIVIIVCGLSFLMLFYDRSLGIETSGYLVYCLMSASYVVKRTKKNEKKKFDRKVLRM